MSYNDVKKITETIPIDPDENKVSFSVQDKKTDLNNGLLQKTNNDLETPSYNKGHSQGGGINALAGFGKISDKLENFPNNTNDAFKIDNSIIPDLNYKTENNLKFVYEDIKLNSSEIEYFDDCVENNRGPITINNLSEEYVRSHQKGFKLTTQGPHGSKTCDPIHFKISTGDDPINFEKIDEKLLDSAMTSKYGFQKMYDHSKNGNFNPSVDSSQKVNLKAPDIQINTRLRGANRTGGHYAGLRAYQY